MSSTLMSPPTRSSHWAGMGESTFVTGVWCLYGVYRLFGRLPFRLCLYPVVFFYWLTRASARRASLDYLRRLRAAGALAVIPTWRTSLRHFACFAETLLDKTLAMSGRYPQERVRFEGREEIVADLQSGRGAMIITAHLGCLELLQATASLRPGLKINILVHTAHAQRFNRILARLNPDSQVQLLQVTEFSVPQAMMLVERVAAGEVVAIAGDRIPVTGDRTLTLPFLGAPAVFPAGPYLMASVLACPVYLLSCLHDGDGYRARMCKFAERVQLPRNSRAASMQAHAGIFVAWLEERLRESPFDWFNFYPFWDQVPHDADKTL
jgi:predicted LPLAT superfamily acyltransferase